MQKMFTFVKYTRYGKLLISKRNYSISNYGGALLVQKLPERNLLRISGKDASTYLQGLITNDMNHLQSGGYSLYTVFLNSKGRVLYDSIVYKTHEENTFFIECDGAGASQLKDHLMHFKVRRKINVDLLSDDFDVWAMTKDDGTCDSHEIPDYKKIRNFMSEKLPELITATDPRLTSMGLRVITPKTTNLASEIGNITELKVKTENYYKLLRYKLGIGEGMQELPTEKCFPMEINADYMHGISFHKGCYIGQELTARTHHTGAIRKRIMPIIFSQKIHSPEPGTPIYSTEQTNKSIGKLLGVEGNNGLAQLRIEEALKAEELLVGKDKCKTHRPFWWPIEAPKTRMKIG